MIILIIIEKLFLGSRDKVIYCTCPKLELKLLKDHSFIMVVQYLIILVDIICNYNVYFCFCYSFSYLNAICYLMYIYLRLYFIYFVNNYFSGPLLITVLIVALIGLPCWNKGFSISIQFNLKANECRYVYIEEKPNIL